MPEATLVPMLALALIVHARRPLETMTSAGRKRPFFVARSPQDTHAEAAFAWLTNRLSSRLLPPQSGCVGDQAQACHWE
jgi:hypothetical protein